MSEDAILAVRGLTVTIAGNGVCRELDFSVAPGQCWAILGRNGGSIPDLTHELEKRTERIRSGGDDHADH